MQVTSIQGSQNKSECHKKGGKIHTMFSNQSNEDFHCYYTIDTTSESIDNAATMTATQNQQRRHLGHTSVDGRGDMTAMSWDPVVPPRRIQDDRYCKGSSIPWDLEKTIKEEMEIAKELLELFPTTATATTTTTSRDATQFPASITQDLYDPIKVDRVTKPLVYCDGNYMTATSIEPTTRTSSATPTTFEDYNTSSSLSPRPFVHLHEHPLSLPSPHSNSMSGIQQGLSNIIQKEQKEQQQRQTHHHVLPLDINNKVVVAGHRHHHEMLGRMATGQDVPTVSPEQGGRRILQVKQLQQRRQAEEQYQNSTSSRSRTTMMIERKLSKDFVPHRFSIIFGRGKQSCDHTGNRRLKIVVSMNLHRYSKANKNHNKEEKSNILHEIVQYIKDSYPDGIDKRGAFVRYNNNDKRWYHVDEFLVREKIGVMFRNFLSTSYKSSNCIKIQNRQRKLKKNTNTNNKN